MTHRVASSFARSVELESTHPDASAGQSRRVIKRYANRKLYDTRDSRYVTLQQIAEYVREGEDVKIIDNTTKEDLTKVTLAQIIYEEEKKDGGSRSSVGTLRKLIQSSGERLMESLREGPMGKLMPKKDGEGESEAEVAAEGEEERAAKDEKGLFRVFSSSKEAIEELSRLADDRMRGLISHAIGRVQQLQRDVAGLQTRIDELEAKLVQMNQREAAQDGGGDDSQSGDATATPSEASAES